MDKWGSRNCLVVVLVTTLSLSYALIPDYLHVCRATDSNLAACINNSVNLLRPRFKSGIPDLNVPPLEPLLLKEIQLRRGPSGAAIDANITNIRVWGPTTFIVTDLKPDIQRNKFHFKVWLPHLHFKGNYELDMKILLISVRGKGPIEGNFTDYRCEILMKGKKVVVDGEEHLKFDKMHLRLDIGKAKIHLENLFNNDPVLKEAADDVLSENSDIFVNEIKPVLERTLAEKFNDIANKITLKYAYKELFP